MTTVPPSGADPRAGLVETDPRPVVALPRTGVPGGVIALMAIGLAILLFVMLDGQRRRASVLRSDVPRGVSIVSPPPLVVPPEPQPTPVVALTLPPPPVYTPLPRTAPERQQPLQTIIVPTPSEPVPMIPAASEPRRQQARLTEPALVVDGGIATNSTTPSASGVGNGADIRSRVGVSGDDTAARATVIRSRTDVMPIGTLIPAVLETPIDTARPGLVRAIVSRDTPGFDGRRVLVPRGSRLIGEYQSDVRGGQNRVLVNWSRLIRPDGVSIRLGSPAADALGGAGVPGQVHSFFLQRFAGAVLQSALQVGVNLASRPGNGSVIVGIPQAPVNAIGQQLQGTNDYRPKITVKQGAVLNIFVARDLDFSGVGSVRQEER